MRGKLGLRQRALPPPGAQPPSEVAGAPFARCHEKPHLCKRTIIAHPLEGSDIAPPPVHSGSMIPRFGLRIGAALAAFVALVLTIAPADWLAGLLNVSGADATNFLVRRYAASATVALFVATAAIARNTAPEKAALLALSAWFAVQGMVAVWGVVFGYAGGFAWAAVVADPIIAAWFFILSARAAKD